MKKAYRNSAQKCGYGREEIGMITRETIGKNLTQEIFSEMMERRDIDDNKKYSFNVNKGKMYSLVQEFSVYQLPQIKETEYFKQSGFNAYWLRFLNENNHIVSACLSRDRWVGNGLRIFCEEEKFDKIYFPSSEQLIEKDLLKKVEKKKERQLTK